MAHPQPKGAEVRSLVVALVFVALVAHRLQFGQVAGFAHALQLIQVRPLV